MYRMSLRTAETSGAHAPAPALGPGPGWLAGRPGGSSPPAVPSLLLCRQFPVVVGNTPRRGAAPTPFIEEETEAASSAGMAPSHGPGGGTWVWVSRVHSRRAQV